MSRGLAETYHTNFPSASLRLLAELGVPALYNPDAPGLSDQSWRVMCQFGPNGWPIIQVNDCEDNTQFTESNSGTFDIATAAATGNRVGTNCMKLSSTAACNNSQYVDTIYIDRSLKIGQSVPARKRQMDWRDTRYLGFWKHAESSAHFGTDGELQVAIMNDGTLSTKVEVDGTSGTVHHFCYVDMDDLSKDATYSAWTRDKVESLRFYCNNANSSEDTYIDNIIRFNILYDRGPFYGCMYPIKSAEALAHGDTVAWSINGLVKETSAAAVDTLGSVILFKDGRQVYSGTGTARHDLWGFVPGVCIFIGRANAANTAGDYLEWAANGLYTDVTGAATEKGFAIGLEAAGAQYDDIFMLSAKGAASD